MPPAGSSGRKRPAVLVAAGVAGLAALAAGAFVLLSGDDEGSAGEDTGDRAGGRAGAPDTPDPSSLTGTWAGTFECAGGESGLTLTIDDPGDGTLGANFAVHGVGETPDDQTSRFSMEGSADGDRLTLEGGQWIRPEQPSPEDVMYALEADLAGRADTDHLEGTLTGGDCTAFSVDRTSTDPWYAGVWEGRYGCAQGVTGLTLTVEPERDEVVAATYDFYAVPENPDVPSGSFLMEGTYDSQRELTLRGVEWVQRPQTYGMVDLLFIAELGVDPQRLYGAITTELGIGDECSVFMLTRAEDTENAGDADDTGSAGSADAGAGGGGGEG